MFPGGLAFPGGVAVFREVTMDAELDGGWLGILGDLTSKCRGLRGRAASCPGLGRALPHGVIRAARWGALGRPERDWCLPSGGWTWMLPLWWTELGQGQSEVI